MKISIIAALAQNRAIGIHNKLPWHIPNDLAHFRAITMGKPIIMGRKTFESLTKPLPGRTNIVITKNNNYFHKNIKIVYNIQSALILAQEIAASMQQNEIMIMGGASIYHQVLPLVQRLYLTYVHRCFRGDSFFPQYDLNQWHEVDRKDIPAEKNTLSYSYLTLDRS